MVLYMLFIGNFTIGRYGDECKYITTKNGTTTDVCLSVN